MTKKAKARKIMNRELASKILRRVPHNKAFYFFTDIGQYSGKFAVSLSDLCKKMETIDMKSVDFHCARARSSNPNKLRFSE